MNLLDIVKQCCYRTGDPAVRSVMGNEDNAIEWLGYVSQAGALIPQEHRWSMLRKDYKFVTTGNKKEYDLPEDFDEICSYYIYNISRQRYIPFASDDEELTKIATRNTSQSTIRFRIMGGKIVFTYPIEDGDTLMLTYMSNRAIKNMNSGTAVYKETFDDDSDEYLLDNELLILKSIALRALNLGLPESGQRETDYQTRLEMCMTKDGAGLKFNTHEIGYFNKTTPVDWSAV